MLFSRLHVAVFVDGCFWHGCPEHGTRPSNNAAWWAKKLDRNIERDRETDTFLTGQGWRVIRIWEHTRTDEAAETVAQALITIRDRLSR